MTNPTPIAKALTWVIKEQIDVAEQNCLDYSIKDSLTVVNDLMMLSVHLGELGGDRDEVLALIQRVEDMEKSVRARPDYGPSSQKDDLAKSPVGIAIAEGFEPFPMMSTVQLRKHMEHADGYWIITKSGGVNTRSNVDVADWNVAAYINHDKGVSDTVVVELASLQQVLDNYKAIPDPQPDANGRRTQTDIPTWADIGVSLHGPRPGM
ncbi:hypothetical protein [Rhizobium sp. MHM7A]|uniref:hypothetical protein n=1 Tax=Rhizobium sp. MHM7A TaxID=2583233 RepID=UPI001105C016|nr:hypothetical protein [Rhizobium sp. MHM7A]TLX15933.1 hypothetical protein FFR93_01050 [Rhizobium sp. MHM7A]